MLNFYRALREGHTYALSGQYYSRKRSCSSARQKLDSQIVGMMFVAISIATALFIGMFAMPLVALAFVNLFCGETFFQALDARDWVRGAPERHAQSVRDMLAFGGFAEDATTDAVQATAMIVKAHRAAAYERDFARSRVALARGCDPREIASHLRVLEVAGEFTREEAVAKLVQMNAGEFTPASARAALDDVCYYGSQQEADAAAAAKLSKDRVVFA